MTDSGRDAVLKLGISRESFPDFATWRASKVADWHIGLFLDVIKCDGYLPVSEVVVHEADGPSSLPNSFDVVLYVRAKLGPIDEESVNKMIAVWILKYLLGDK